MQLWRQRISARAFRCALWVGLCFGVTSAVYLAWLNRLVTLTGGAAADWLSMGLGYLLQAAGMGLSCLLMRRDPEGDFTFAFRAAALLYAAVSVPALAAGTALPVVCFGELANLLYGVIAGFYLCAIARCAAPERRARVFGGGYALATVGVGLLSLAGGGVLLHGPFAPLLYLALIAAMAAWAGPLGALKPPDAPAAPPKAAEDGGPTLLGLCLLVALISMVKNMGFGFPSADIQAGVIPELSRLPYAAGLLAAGVIHDKSRRQGMLCAAAALVLPFIMLGLSGEPVPAAICWGLDYLFFGFFSVFRAVLFLDMAGHSRRWCLAPLGLLLGRLGDAAGTAACLLLAGQRVALIGAAALAFFPTLWLFFRQYQRLYAVEAVQQRSEQEVFEAFCLHNDLSAREKDVLRMIIDNRTNGETAEALFISESTVKYHVRNVLQKTGCKNRVELQRKYTLALYPRLAPQAGPDAGRERT